MAISSLRPLRSRNFALVWSAALVSNVGSWMQAVALGVLVTAETHEPGWTGVVAAAAFVPAGLLAPVGGALADRLDHRRWLTTTTLAEAAMAATLATLCFTHHAAPGLVTLVAFLGGCASAVGFPTYQAMLPDLVAREQLLAAVSLSSAQFNFGRVVGPALSAAVLPLGASASRLRVPALDQLTTAAGWVFVINAVSFGAVVGALALTVLPRRQRSAVVEPIVRRIGDGVRLAFGEPGCRSAIVLIGIVALLGSPFIALVPAVAIVGLHAGAGGTSALVTSQGMGAVAGALALAPAARVLGRRRLLLRALFALPCALVAYGLAPTLWSAAAAIFVVGACYIGVLSGLNTVVQLRAPVEARGRVLSLYMLSLGTIYPIGALLQGQIANHAGIRPVTAGSGVVLLVAMAALVVAGRSLFAHLQDPVAEPAVPEPVVAGEAVAP